MCGIICAIKKDKKGPPLRTIVREQFLAQRNRGTEGFGILEIMPDGKCRVLRTTDVTDFLIMLRMDVHKDAMAIVAHHRIPTSSANRIDQTHPILVENPQLTKEWFISHNGVISNDDELKKLHEKEGFLYSTEYTNKPYSAATYNTTKFNDSESLGIELALVLESLEEKLRTRGSAAFIIVGRDPKTHKVDAISFGRNSANPLEFTETKSHILIASDLVDGEMLAPHKLFTIELPSLNTISRPLFIPDYGYSTREDEAKRAAANGVPSITFPTAQEHKRIPEYLGGTASKTPLIGNGDKPVTGFTPKNEERAPRTAETKSTVDLTKEVMAAKEVDGDKEDAEEVVEYYHFQKKDVEEARDMIFDDCDTLLMSLDDDADVADMNFELELENLVEELTRSFQKLYDTRYREVAKETLKEDDEKRKDAVMEASVNKILAEADNDLDKVRERAIARLEKKGVSPVGGRAYNADDGGHGHGRHD